MTEHHHTITLELSAPLQALLAELVHPWHPIHHHHATAPGTPAPDVSSETKEILRRFDAAPLGTLSAVTRKELRQLLCKANPELHKFRQFDDQFKSGLKALVQSNKDALHRLQAMEATLAEIKAAVAKEWSSTSVGMDPMPPWPIDAPCGLGEPGLSGGQAVQDFRKLFKDLASRLKGKVVLHQAEASVPEPEPAPTLMPKSIDEILSVLRNDPPEAVPGTESDADTPDTGNPVQQAVVETKDEELADEPPRPSVGDTLSPAARVSGMAESAEMAAAAEAAVPRKKRARRKPMGDDQLDPRIAEITPDMPFAQEWAIRKAVRVEHASSGAKFPIWPDARVEPHLFTISDRLYMLPVCLDTGLPWVWPSLLEVSEEAIEDSKTPLNICHKFEKKIRPVFIRWSGAANHNPTENLRQRLCAFVRYDGLSELINGFDAALAKARAPLELISLHRARWTKIMRGLTEGRDNYMASVAAYYTNATPGAPHGWTYQHFLNPDTAPWTAEYGQGYGVGWREFYRAVTEGKCAEREWKTLLAARKILMPAGVFGEEPTAGNVTRRAFDLGWVRTYPSRGKLQGGPADKAESRPHSQHVKVFWQEKAIDEAREQWPQFLSLAQELGMGFAFPL